MHAFTVIFLLALALTTGVQLWLAWRQVRHVASHRAVVPSAFADRITPESHRRAADYTVAKTRLGMAETLFGVLVLLLWTLGGGLSLLDSAWHSLALGPVATGVGFLLSLFLIGSLVDLPFSLVHTFGIEQRFGFNRTSAGLYFSDLIKGALLGALIGTPMAALVLWLMDHAGALWWLYAWLVWIGFTLLMLWAYPTFIAPLFNQFSPLDNPSLVARIEALLRRCGFEAEGVFVMDGSRRSAHGNAYFTGLGRHKRIVFFDTLLNTLNEQEMEAVLAHELGHYRRKHVRQRLITVSLFSFTGLALLGWLSGEPWFYSALGVEQASAHTALALFLLVSPVFTLFTQPLLARTLRRHEFEADDFAAEQTQARDLIQALVKLYRDNASTLTPDPLYSAFHDSHPPAPVRVAHLERNATAS